MAIRYSNGSFSLQMKLDCKPLQSHPEVYSLSLTEAIQGRNRTTVVVGHHNTSYG